MHGRPRFAAAIIVFTMRPIELGSLVTSRPAAELLAILPAWSATLAAAFTLARAHRSAELHFQMCSHRPAHVLRSTESRIPVAPSFEP